MGQGIRHAIDFLNIDTEGHVLNVLRSFNLDKIDVRVIKIEHKHTGKEEIMQVLEKKIHRLR